MNEIEKLKAEARAVIAAYKKGDDFEAVVTSLRMPASVCSEAGGSGNPSRRGRRPCCRMLAVPCRGRTGQLPFPLRCGIMCGVAQATERKSK